ncbi:hypothetical protein FACS189496_3250 [Bacilli bacterium]|nr:hypothetical protein FACS189496_3250 [Bacilli bacterium]
MTLCHTCSIVFSGDSDDTNSLYTKQVTIPIPDKYIGTELEIIVFPIAETSGTKVKHSLQTLKCKTPVLGCAKGRFKMSDDFDAPLDDFKEYM